MSPEVPRAEWLVSKYWLIGIATFESKSCDANHGQAPTETTAKKGFRIGVDLQIVDGRGFGVGERRAAKKIRASKEEGFETDVVQISGGHSREYPGSKLRSGASKVWEKTSTLPRQSIIRRHGRMTLRDCLNNSVRKTLG